MTIKKELINDLLLEVTGEQELFGKNGLLQQPRQSRQEIEHFICQ